MADGLDVGDVVRIGGIACPPMVITSIRWDGAVEVADTVRFAGDGGSIKEPYPTRILVPVQPRTTPDTGPSADDTNPTHSIGHGRGG